MDIFAEKRAVEAIALLSPRELEMAVLASQGYTASEIAEIKELSYHTVSVHMHHARQKLGVHSASQVAVICTLAGLVTRWRS